MNANDWLTERFEANRARLKGVAYRMLGSATQADDAVQETWLKLHRADTSGVGNIDGWLTTVTARVCLDMLRSRKAKREESIEPGSGEPEDVEASTIAPLRHAADPAEEAALAESVGLAMLVVLNALSPGERVAFVLHDLFGLPFQEVGPILGRSEDAARQLASRARRRVRGAESPAPDVARQREVLDAFLAASRAGDFEKLVALLAPEVVLRADSAVAKLGGAPRELRGAEAVAEFYVGRAVAGRTALLDGAVGIVVAPLGRLLLVVRVSFAEGRIAALEAVADAPALAAIEVTTG